jgi:hypothetical protein
MSRPSRIGEDGEEGEYGGGGKYTKTPVIEVSQNACRHRGAPRLKLHQVGTVGGIGMPVGLLVDGVCVTCNGSSRRCVHRSVYEKRTAGEKLSTGVKPLGCEALKTHKVCASLDITRSL